MPKPKAETWSWDAFLHELNLKTGGDEGAPVATAIHEWAQGHGVRLEAQKGGANEYTGYLLILDHGGQEYGLFKLAVSGQLQFCTGGTRSGRWFQQKPPFASGEDLKTRFHEKLQPLAGATYSAGEGREKVRMALRAVAGLTPFPGSDQDRKAKFALAWLKNEEPRRLFLEAFTWVVEQIREHGRDEVMAG